MANDYRYFLNIDGIQGDSTDRKYPKPWITLLECELARTKKDTISVLMPDTPR